MTLSASWPWLKDITCKNNRTTLFMPAVNEGDGFDSRPLVADLISEHRLAIDEMKESLAEIDGSDCHLLYDPNKHDDLWILRFLLSHKNNRIASLEAAKKTLLFRKKHSLDDEDIRCHPFQNATQPATRKMKQFMDHDAVSQGVYDPSNGGTVKYCRLDGFHHKNFQKEMTQDDVLLSILYQSEWSFQWNDYITRKTGRLTKETRIIDADGFRVTHLMNRKAVRLNANATKCMDTCYPQLVHNTFVFGAPLLLRKAWALTKPIFPPGLVNKMIFVEPRCDEKDQKKLLACISNDFFA
jgi:hypothetical protein